MPFTSIHTVPHVGLVHHLALLVLFFGALGVGIERHGVLIVLRFLGEGCLILLGAFVAQGHLVLHDGVAHALRCGLVIHCRGLEVKLVDRGVGLEDEHEAVWNLHWMGAPKIGDLSVFSLMRTKMMKTCG